MAQEDESLSDAIVTEMSRVFWRELSRATEDLTNNIASLVGYVFDVIFLRAVPGDREVASIALGQLFLAPSNFASIPKRVLVIMATEIFTDVFDSARTAIGTRVIRADQAFEWGCLTLIDVVEDIQAFIVTQSISLRMGKGAVGFAKFRSDAKGWLNRIILRALLPAPLELLLRAALTGLISTTLNVLVVASILVASVFSACGGIIWFMFTVYWARKIDVDLLLFQGKPRKRCVQASPVREKLSRRWPPPGSQK